ncbi:hypothetical protein LD006_25880 [Bacteroides xylanisolvens]|uniref:hypothetical protein n=1 Tax=Bacteroides xylanisolvens TaxID=371601 RepID=UPI001CDD5BDE|nr:hypothetical protein [Bacteroides xylanisolvens]MCA4567333.1 hypothetical protein [Bacteroides xylanisolvens]
MSMKAKNTIMMALAGILLISCKDKTYKPPTLDAMRSADKARAAWARETEEHPATVEIQSNNADSIAVDSTSTNSNTIGRNKNEHHSSIEETEE